MDTNEPVTNGNVVNNPDVTMDSGKEKKQIMKNIILISIAFLMNFNAFQGLARLQSTLNLEEGIGEFLCSFAIRPLIS